MEPKPIQLDPAVEEVLYQSPPLLDLLQNPGPKREVIQSDDEQPETVDELIAALESIRESYGGDTPVRDWECGTGLYVSATEWEDGETRVKL